MRAWNGPPWPHPLCSLDEAYTVSGVRHGSPKRCPSSVSRQDRKPLCLPAQVTFHARLSVGPGPGFRTMFGCREPHAATPARRRAGGDGGRSAAL